jgi:PAS domain S-box-containing protein
MYVSGDINRIAQEALLDAVAGPAFIVDREYRYLAFNEANRRAVDDLYGVELAVGASLLDVVKPAEERGEMRACIDRALAGETHTDARWYGRGGDRRYYTITYAPVMRDGVVIGVAMIAVDATDLLQAQEAVTALSGLMDSVDDAIGSWSADGTVVTWSAGAERMSGFPAAEVVGRPIHRFSAPGHEADLERVLAAVAAGTRVERFPTEMLRRDGSVGDVEVTVNPIRSQDGSVVGATAVAHDVTALHLANAQLLREREFERTLIENIADGVAACDADGALIMMNRAARDVAGIDANVVLALRPPEGVVICGPDGVTPLGEDEIPLARALRGEHPTDQSFTVRREGVPARSMIASGDVFRNEAGDKLGAVVVMHDVTDRNAMTEALRRSEEKFEAAFRCSPDAININRLSDGLYLEINDGFTALTGFTGEDVAGRTSTDIAIWADAPGRERLVDGLRSEGHVDRLEARFRRKDGSLTTAEMSARLVVIDGEPYILSVTRDVSESKRAQADLESSRERLERLSRDVVETLGRVVETRDPYTKGHEVRAADLCRRIATRMGLSEPDIDALETAALVHDIGKLSVPAEILTKPGRLTPLEYALIREHPRSSYEILKDIAFEAPVADVVLQHHERMDGSGYPEGLCGDQILMSARILAVADVVEAMATHRPYRPALGLDAAIEELREHAEKYDPDVVAAFLELCDAGSIEL